MSLVSISGKRIILVGLGGVGKTSIALLLKTLNVDIARNTQPSITIEKYKKRLLNGNLDLYVTPGQRRFLDVLFRRRHNPSMIFNRMLEDADIVIYVVDSSNQEKLEEMFKFFKYLVVRLLEMKRKKKLILLAHKQDLPNALNEDTIRDLFITPLLPVLRNSELKIEIFGTSIYKPQSLLKVLAAIVEDEAQNLLDFIRRLKVLLEAETIFIGDSEGILISSIGDRELSLEYLLFVVKLRELWRNEISIYSKVVLKSIWKKGLISFNDDRNSVMFIINEIDDNYFIIIGLINAGIKKESIIKQIYNSIDNIISAPMVHNMDNA